MYAIETMLYRNKDEELRAETTLHDITLAQLVMCDSVLTQKRHEQRLLIEENRVLVRKERIHKWLYPAIVTAFVIGWIAGK